MKNTKETQQKIKKAIKQLNLKEKDLDLISITNMNKICDIVGCDLINLMYYLRFER